VSPKSPKQAAPEGRYVNLVDLDAKIGSLPATSTEQCHRLYEFVLTNPVSQILELGFAHGKSSVYMAAALADKGSALVTTIDLRGAHSCKPSILEVAAMTALAPCINPIFNPIFSDVGSAWEMGKMILESTDAERHCKPVFGLGHVFASSLAWFFPAHLAQSRRD
jgi:hypothetical protein